MTSQEKLKKLKEENPDSSKWSKWLKVIIAILSAIVGALGGASLSSCSSPIHDVVFSVDTFQGHEYVFTSCSDRYGFNFVHSPNCNCLNYGKDF